MSVNSILLWEKYRPKTFEDVILLPRIRKQFESGVSQHFIFYGHFGTGKTSLARILIGKYSKKSAYLELNCSMDTSIEILRTEIDSFCKVSPMLDSDSDIKFVFLDEFERVSSNFQDAFKAFIEKYNNKVRFIIVTNHINKISDGLKSRIKTINFDCLDSTEEKFLKVEYYKKICNNILPSEKREIEKQNLISMINRKFPDFRSTLVEIQDFFDTGGVSNQDSTISQKVKFELYSLIESKTDYETVYHFVMKRFGPERIHHLISLLGRPFIEYCIEKKFNIEKLFLCNYIVADYSSKLENNTDPVVLAIAIIGKFQEVLH